MREDILGAVSFLTIFGRGHEPTNSSRYWFSFSGVLVGFISGSVWWLLRKVHLPLVDAAIVVLVILVVTGAIHIDGLADASDGLLAHLPRHRRFEVMSGPEVGAFGVTAVVMTLIIMTASLSTISPDPLLLVGLMGLSRALCALAIELFPYAKAEGIVSSFNESSHRGAGSVGVLAAEAVVCTALVVASMPFRGAALAVTVLGVQAIILWRAGKLLGGYTGDVLGASIVVSETLALVVGALVQR